MANECMNYITIKGDKDLIQLFADSYLTKRHKNLDNDGDRLANKKLDYSLDFNIIAPIPENCENDYVFRIQNWGNKWDGTNAYIAFYDDDEIFIDVSTAWSPCVPITLKLIELCPGLYIKHEYYESGCGFVGWIEHQANEEPKDYEEVEYSVSDDPHNYWFWMFEKEYESFDWLCEHIDYLVEEKEITKEEYDDIRSMIEYSSIQDVVAYCIDKEVL